MPGPAPIIAGTASVLGLIVDAQDVAAQALGTSEVVVNALPQTIDLFVGDSVKVEYQITFRYEVGTLRLLAGTVADVDENVVFDLRFLLNGRVVHRLREPLIGAFDRSTTRRVDGQIWFGATSYACDDSGANVHRVSVAASIVDLGEMEHAVNPGGLFPVSRP